MRLILLIVCVLAISAMAQDVQLRPIEVRPVSKAIHAVRTVEGKDEADVQLLVGSVLLEVKMPRGRSDKAELFVLFDPATGFYQWFFTTSIEPTRSVYLADFTSPSGHKVAYADKEGLTVFEAGWPALGVRESRARAQSLDEAQAKSLREAAAWLPDFERGDKAKWREISLLSLGRDLEAAKGHEEAGPMKMLQVSKQNGNWVVAIQAQWKEEIILNDKFELVGMTRVE